MTISALFAHLPGDYVSVTHLGLNYKARVTRSILTHSSQTVYEVEYNADGELKTREFYADEIS